MNKKLIVNADDFGMSKGTTDGIVKAHLDGIVTSASLVTTTPYFDYAVDVLKTRCQNLGVGLHFNLSVGKPVLPPEKVPLLINEQGFFKCDFSSLLWSAWLKSSPALLCQIELEMEAQILKIKNQGIQLDHVNGERHIHMIPSIFRIVVKLAKKNNISFVRTVKDNGFRQLRFWYWFQPLFDGGFIKSSLLSFLNKINMRWLKQTGNSSHINKTDYFFTLLYTGKMESVIPSIVKNPPQGVTEVMVHPAFSSKGEDLNFCSPTLKAYLQMGGKKN